ncbi:tetraacyldisaccharide 4'-kinase [Alteromonas sp. 1_MG-2023]|uniref:tetraacyldisaccharide 4'-kinase n=1 Tax=Alteromonas sp. 1_MG-2023 TaxID=3062669 RepID=UPI0026E464BC|nr:tetraacyldisaccharide 4'-kinase [Alteromonas sp. 1_MG-2023]MDO6565997.1 tetraacyldisaccharide 4'-kinase [Alteromonas sp. 1_MG-2023]
MSRVVKSWYAGHPLVWLLSPLTVLFWLISTCRRLAFRAGLKKIYRGSAKVIVVGNISVGGNGKTPVVLALAQYYRKKGVSVGILSRGYGGKSSYYPRKVTGNDAANEVGDEPRLLAIRSQVPVVIDPIRSRGADYLSNELHCDLIICDDGLQHYALARDVEVVVMDERLTGSGLLLPMGPLREGHWRLATVDAIVHNRADIKKPALKAGQTPQYLMHLKAGEMCSVTNPTQQIGIDRVSAKTITAMAGIGAPERFFTQLESMGLTLSTKIPFPDHHQFTVEDIPAGTVLMTEKDAVKVSEFAHNDCWYLPVSASIDPQFFTQIDNKLVNAGLIMTP